MSYSQGDPQDSYHDDPIEPQSPQRKKASALAALVLFAVGGLFLQSTLAANLSINSGTPVEFGQGISATTACSGETVLTMTPNSVFTNAGGAGVHYLSSITVSKIPTECSGKDFTINAYNDSDNTALRLFATTSTNAVVYDHAGTFEVGTGGTGMSISTGDGTFTITFDAPVAVSSSVFKLTMQSGAHTPVIYVPTTYNYGWASQHLYLTAGTVVWGAAASSDGSKLIVGGSGTTPINRSINSGTTWVASTSSGSRYWREVASSLDGSVLAGIELTGGYIWISVDSGGTWTSQADPGTPSWQTVAVSGDGSVILAAAWNGHVWTRNSGSWHDRTNPGSRAWSGASASTNGTSLVLVDEQFSGYVYISSDSGATWVTHQQSTSSQKWMATSMSGDGTRIALVPTTAGSIYISSDSGATWAARTGAGSKPWSGVSMSTDGSKIVAADSAAGYIWLSSDYGSTWSSSSAGTGTKNWLSVAISGSGNMILGGTDNGYVWVGSGT